MSTKRSCDLCEFSYHDPKHPPTGRYQCRRFPPALTEGRRWPQVTEYEWCGEFQPRVAPAST